MSFDLKSSYSLFDALKPAADLEVTHAVVATYSLDLVTLLGLVLALGGNTDEEFETGPIGLIDAFRRMTGRLKVLCQKGRIVVPRRHHSILVVLDGMVRQISTNENAASWHPKFAFVRYRGSDQISWRFWIGSRNLTGSRDLEAGLLLTGKPGAGRGATIGDIADLADAFFENDDLSLDILAELKEVRWLAPAGIKVSKIHWRRAGTVVPFLTTNVRHRQTWAISPFVDKTGISLASKFAGGSFGLLTTEESAKTIAFSAQVEARIMAAPEPLGCDSSEAPAEPAQADFQDISPSKGLHAKLLVQRRGAKSTLFVGSSNLTRRGMNGPNAEIMAELDVTDQHFADGLITFFNFQQKAILEEAAVEDSDEAARIALDQDVCDLLAVEFSLRVDGVSLSLIANGTFDDFLSRNSLAVQLLSMPVTRSEWLPKTRSLVLHEGEVPLKSQTSLVIFEAASKSDRNVKRSWTQLISFLNLDLEKRDRAAIAAYVGPGKFKDWLRSTLEGVVPVEAESWTGEPKASRVNTSLGASESIFALEYVLGRWARNPIEFERRIPDVSSMLLAFREEIDRLVEGTEREASRKDLEEVEAFWASVSEAVGAGSS